MQKEDMTLEEIIKLAPRIGVVLRSLKPARRIDRRYQQYSDAKRQLSQLVGWGAQLFVLRDSRIYDVVIGEVIKRLKL